MKAITLCADDYGQNPAISQAIIALAEGDRLSATSCLTNSFYWPNHAKWLLPLKDKIQCGIHFNLTEGKPLSHQFKSVYGDKMFSLGNLLLKSFLSQLDLVAIEYELDAQIDRFIECMGFAPLFLDGHQHIHHFPVIREAVFSIYQKRFRKHQSFIRSVYDDHFPRHAFFKKLIIQWSGAKQFKNRLNALSIPHNASFSGVYDFSPKINYEKLFSQFLDESAPGGIIMCHPALALNSDPDPIFESRRKEYDFLASPEFLRICLEKQVELT